MNFRSYKQHISLHNNFATTLHSFACAGGIFRRRRKNDRKRQNRKQGGIFKKEKKHRKGRNRKQGGIFKKEKKKKRAK